MLKDGFHIEVFQEARNLVSFLLHTDAYVSKWIFSRIYGAIHVEDKIFQWSTIQQLSENYNLPWILLGDLNKTLAESEK